MKAVCWQGKTNVQVDNVPDPKILNPRDAIVRITLTAICGSDLHLYDGYIPTMEPGDILGHEFMGEIVELGSEVKNLSVGDKVVVPFPISCGRCYFCEHDLWSACDNSNPNASMAEAISGFAGAALYGYSHMYGGYAGGQAQYARVPFADVGPIKIPEGVPDDRVLFLSDIFATGYQAAEWGEVKGGDVVAVWGCGPVGQFAIRSALLMGAERVIAIDRFPERLELAGRAGADVVDYSEAEDLVEVLKQMTGGRGPDVCIDAVGMESHGSSIDWVLDRGKQAVKLQMDRANVLRQVIQACRKGGVVSVAGVYAGYIDKFPYGVAFAKGLTLRGGQAHVHKHLPKLLDHILRGDIDPSEIITHRVPLDRAPEMYEIFKRKQDGCVKVVLEPGT